MPREVTCPSCKRRLLVPPDVIEKWLTCPRCLSSIGNPNILLTPEAPAAREALQAEPASRTCPHCDRPVERDWRFCPYCEEELKRPPSTGDAGPLERDVKRDTLGGSIVAGVLGTLLLLGIIIFFAMDGPKLLSQSQDAQGVVALGGVVLVLVLLGTVIIAFRSRNKTASMVSGMVGGLVFGAGIAMLVGLLACLAVAAAITDFLNTCTKGCH